MTDPDRAREIVRHMWRDGYLENISSYVEDTIILALTSVREEERENVLKACAAIKKMWTIPTDDPAQDPMDDAAFNAVERVESAIRSLGPKGRGGEWESGGEAVPRGNAEDRSSGSFRRETAQASGFHSSSSPSGEGKRLIGVEDVERVYGGAASRTARLEGLLREAEMALRLHHTPLAVRIERELSGTPERSEQQ